MIASGEPGVPAMSGLPLRARWLVRETLLDWDFTRAQRNLRILDESDLNFGPVPEAWRPLQVFGECSFAEGGGASAYICISLGTGEVCGLDVEREEGAVFLFNSSLEQFIRTFTCFDQKLTSGQASGATLASAAREIDDAAYERSEWRLLADYLHGKASGA